MAPLPQQAVLVREPCFVGNLVDQNVSMPMVNYNLTDTVQSVLLNGSDLGNSSSIEYFSETNLTNIITNTSSLAADTNGNLYSDEAMRKLNEFHIIKAVVLSVVTLVILVSICKMVFGMILKYPGKTDK
ncbi:hypothetical protein CBL_12733 [Carabus blaptoides fortunei]